MKSAVFPRLLLAGCLSVAAAVAGAQPGGKPYVPEPGEIGKDVMWLPSDDVMVRKMLDLAGVTSRDYLIDLGSGDGRTVIAAARRGARALGVEFNPDLVDYARRRAAKAGVGERARFIRGDLFETDLSPATVITLFLLDEINLKLRPKLLGLKPGTRIVSNTFTMGDWQADRTVKAGVSEGCTAYCEAYLWTVPAKVAGNWKAGNGVLALKQSYQMLTGTLRSSGRATAVTGRLAGDRISLEAGGARYAGRVNGDAIEGTVTTGAGTSAWRASRAPRAAAERSYPVSLIPFHPSPAARHSSLDYRRS